MFSYTPAIEYQFMPDSIRNGSNTALVAAFESTHGISQSAGAISSWASRYNSLETVSPLAQATTANQPDYVATGGTSYGAGTYPVVRFTSTNSQQLVQSTGLISLNNVGAIAIVAVLKMRGAIGGGNTAHMIANTSDGSGFAVFALARTGNTNVDSGSSAASGDYFIRGRRNATDTAANDRFGTSPADTWVIYTGVYAYSNRELQLWTGTTINKLYATVGTAGNTSSGGWLTYCGGNNSNYSDIDLMGLYFYNKRFAGNELQNLVKSYLKLKWKV